MKETLHQTCVLYFSTGNKSSKSFSSKKRKSNAVQQVLFKKTLSEIVKTNLPFVISNGEKFGDDFSKRIKGCIQNTFEKGFDSIIIVGDDTPLMDAKLILEAAKSLEQNELSIAPTKDGGSYLIAIGKKDFEIGVLTDLPWQKDDFHKRLIENLEDLNLPYQSFNQLNDIDHELDIDLFIKQNNHHAFAKILYQVYKTILYILPILNHQTESGFSFSIKYRGPPIAA